MINDSSIVSKKIDTSDASKMDVKNSEHKKLNTSSTKSGTRNLTNDQNRGRIKDKSKDNMSGVKVTDSVSDPKTNPKVFSEKRRNLSTRFLKISEDLLSDNSDSINNNNTNTQIKDPKTGETLTDEDISKAADVLKALSNDVS